jgi:CHAT domain-containing protein/Tfp pilus assembly protein PilF
MNEELGRIDRETLFPKSGKKPSELQLEMGLEFKSKGDFQAAEKSFSRAASLAASAKEGEVEADAYLQLASLHMNLNRFLEARDFADKAIETTKQRSTRLIALSVKSGASYAMGLYTEALNYGRQLAEQYRTAGEEREEAWALSSLGATLSLMGKSEEAIAAFERSLEVNKKLDDRREVAVILCQISLDQSLVGEYEKALTALDEAAEISSQLDDCSLKGGCLRLKGDLYLYRIASLHDALVCYTGALDEFSRPTETPDVRQRVLSLLGLSETSSRSGEYERAEQYLQAAIEVCGSSEPLLITKANCYKQLAEFYSNTKKFSDAAKSVKHAIDIFSSLHIPRFEAAAYEDLARVDLESEEYDDAISCVNKAIAIYRENGIQSEIASAKNLLAQILYGAGRFEDSKIALESAVSEFGSDESDPTALAYCHAGLGVTFERLGQQQSALLNLTRAVELLDSLRSRMDSEDLRLSFQGRESSVHGEIIKLCFQLGDLERAFHYLERSKSRVLLEQIRTTDLRRPRDVEKPLAEKEEALLGELNACVKRGEHIGRAHGIERELREVWSTMQRRGPTSIELAEYLSLRRGDSLEASELISLAKERMNVAVLEYFVLKDTLLIFVVSSRAGKLEVYSKTVKSESMKALTASVLEEVRSGANGRLGTLLREMSSYLLDPVADAIADVEHIHVVPHSFLHRIPLHALPYDGRTLIDRYSMSYSPSASILRYLVRKPSTRPKASLVVGASKSDLVFGELEARRIASILGCNAVVGNEATRQYLCANLENKDIISFSCHAKFDPRDALNSRVMLPSGEVITARDWFKTRISSQLVSLSACETGESQERPGDEMIGLVRSIIFAGGRSILASLWPVNDLAAYITMTKFYEKYYEEGLSRPQSLREAQLFLRDLTTRDLSLIIGEMRREGYALPGEVDEILRMPHEAKPFDGVAHWGAFELIGDWD